MGKNLIENTSFLKYFLQYGAPGMLKRFRLIGVFILLSFFSSHATYVAVLETLCDEDNALALTERQYLTNVLRELAVNVLPVEQGFTIMTRENINMMLPPGKSVEDCEGSCLAETGRNIAADYVAQARVGRFGTSLTIGVELYETASGKLVASFNGRGDDVFSLENLVNEKGMNLFVKVKNTIGAQNTAKYSIENQDDEQGVALDSNVIDSNLVAESSIEKNEVEKIIESDSANAGFVEASAVLEDTLKSEIENEDVLDLRYESTVSESAEIDVHQNPDVQLQQTSRSVDARKSLWGGISFAATYNDYYGTKLGLKNIVTSGNDYSLKVENADGLIGNYWGIGGNLGLEILFMFSSKIGFLLGMEGSYWLGSGNSVASVILTWNDSSKLMEKDDLDIQFSECRAGLDVPLMVRFYGPSFLYAEIGSKLAFNVYSESETSITDYYGERKFRETNGINFFELDLAFGMGLSKSIGMSVLDLGLRFVLGLTDVDRSEDAAKTWQFQLRAVYWFL